MEASNAELQGQCDQIQAHFRNSHMTKSDIPREPISHLLTSQFGNQIKLQSRLGGTYHTAELEQLKLVDEKYKLQQEETDLQTIFDKTEMQY